MSRDLFGNKRKLRKEKDYHYKTSEWDITKEKLKIVLWIILSALYMYYIMKYCILIYNK